MVTDAAEGSPAEAVASVGNWAGAVQLFARRGGAALGGRGLWPPLIRAAAAGHPGWCGGGVGEVGGAGWEG